MRVVVALAILALPLGAQDAVPAHDTLTIVSRAVGEARRINVYTPPAYRASPATKFPVLYMPDGGIDEDFPHVVNTVDSLIALRVIRPVIVVGIPNTQRRRDLTGPTRVHSDSTIAPKVGGSAAFRRFVREELIPAIDTRYRTTEERGLIGESLAGLFVVETFLLEPSAFTHYIAFDPSVWWNGGAMVDSSAAMINALDGKRRTLFLTASRDAIDHRTTTLAEHLRASAPKSLTWVYTPRSDLTHATIFRGMGPTALATSFK